MDEYVAIIDAIREEAEANPPTVELTAKKSGTSVFDVVMVGNA